MRFFILIFMIIFFNFPSFAVEDIVCSPVNINDFEKENLFYQLTGISFLSEKTAELLIANEFKSELNSKVNADLEIFNTNRLKNGEFKFLSLKSKSLKYKSFSISDFNAKSICPYNKVIYTSKRIYFPEQIPFNFQAQITNNDIKNIINSEDFKKALTKNPIKINGIKILEVEIPSLEIKNNRLYFSLTIKPIIGEINIKFNTDIYVEDNTILLKDINLKSKINIPENILNILTDMINPIKYQFNSLNGKFCKIYITKAKISDNIINTEGVFFINKNYTGEQ